MSAMPTTSRISVSASPTASATGMVAACLAVMVGAAVLAGWLPISFSIATVFLFAGPHNWLEARYFLAQMPARWGKLRGYFCVGLGGVFVLTSSFLALYTLDRWFVLDAVTAELGYGAWNSCLVLWLAWLVTLRSRQPPRRDWSLVWPVAFGLISFLWFFPGVWALVWVYLHPLIALWFLDRELLHHRPQWRKAYRCCLACLPLVLALLWWRLADAPPLPGDDLLTGKIVRHAGGNLLPGVSNHLLVATHTFLEMLHYGVWIVALPALSLGTAPWRTDVKLPLAQRSRAWRRAMIGLLMLGIGLMLVLWLCFAADYATTRDVYFTVAIFHVLAEAPFLLRRL